jgi:hypothetical protein
VAMSRKRAVLLGVASVLVGLIAGSSWVVMKFLEDPRITEPDRAIGSGAMQLTLVVSRGERT